MAKEYDWLKAEHEIYVAWRDEWRRNERRLRGGGAVLPELRPFLWEEEGGEHHEARQHEAVYVNWPDSFATIMTGHLLREAPTPDSGGLDFGTLGPVLREATAADPTFAELVYYNVDGSGQDGSEWDAWWMAAEKRAMATGHRWIYTEGSPIEARNAEDILYRGARPYLVEFSPLTVPWWHFDHGRLVAAIVRVALDSPRVENGSIVGVGEKGYLLMTAAGFGAFGDEFANGGWWIFNADRDPLWTGELEEPGRSGDWTFTRGEIPMVPLFWERDVSDPDVDDEAARPAMSRPALTELGNLAISGMNIDSAADFDAWEAGSSMTYMVNISNEAYKLAVSKQKDGSKFIPVLGNADGSDPPEIVEGSAGAVQSQVFDTRMESKRAAAGFLAAHIATSVPESSGVSKEVGFAEGKSPRLALAAKYLQQAQNACIRFLEMRFGAARPTGSVAWPREYDLRDILKDVSDIFGIEQRSGLHSATLGSKLMLLAARSKGFIASDDEAATIEEEYKEAAEQKATERANAAQAFSQAGITE